MASAYGRSLGGGGVFCFLGQSGRGVWGREAVLRGEGDAGGISTAHSADSEFFGDDGLHSAICDRKTWLFRVGIEIIRVGELISAWLPSCCCCGIEGSRLMTGGCETSDDRCSSSSAVAAAAGTGSHPFGVGGQS